MSRIVFRWLAPFQIALAAGALGQTTVDYTVDFQVATSPTTPILTLSWTLRQASHITAQKIHRRLKGETVWVKQADLATTDTSYADPTAVEGVEYEYWMQRTFSGISPTNPMGYVAAGSKVPFIESRGTLLLVIDDTMVTPLAPEIAQLRDDLTGDGWNVQQIVALRSSTPPTVKAQILAAYNAAPASVKSVYLLGHVPVPYSGLINPDGHPDHYGAWPADGYYGDMNGTWTDTTANSTQNATRIQNVPGDGKFDQSGIPSDLELQVGRVDLSNMTKAPAPAIAETDLLRRYLRKAHDFRHVQGAYANIRRVSLIRDGFGTFGSEDFASNGWATAFTCVGRTIDQAPANGWYTTAATNTYLFGHGDGGGSYESASSVGSTTEFGRNASRVVFTQLFGSYHGDFDATNDFMRAPLAGNADGTGLGLSCCWAGRPAWFFHPCGMGETIGYSARISQNNDGTAYQFANFPTRGIHLALMGDPALRFHMVIPPRNLAATSASSQVSLQWDASTETNLLGYHVYRAATTAGPFTRLTTTPLATNSFTDATATAGQTYAYMVRTLKLESSPGGTYQNLSAGEYVTLTVNAGATGVPFNPGALTIQPVLSNQTILTWKDNASDETGVRVERKTGPGGTYATAASLAPGTTTWTDPGPLAAPNVYYYRVFASNAAGSSLASNEVYADANAGLDELQTTYIHVNRGVGSVTIPVTRFAGSTGATSVTGSTSDTSTVAGTHYTAVNAPIAFADGENTSKNTTITLLTPSQPQLPRSFKYTLTNPTNATQLGATSVSRVVIEDPRSVLASPWQQILLGTVTDSSLAVSAEGAIGDCIAWGSVTTQDNGRLIYQVRSGDGVLTAFVDTALPVQANSRIGVMVRGTLVETDPMVSALVAGDSNGTNLYTRPTASANATIFPNNLNALQAPRWLRLTRSGNSFTAETSTDGANFTTVGTTTLALPTTANWGLFHYSDASGDFQTARFRYVTLTDIGVLSAPTSLSGATLTSPARNQLSWDPVGGATGYQIEARPLYGTFSVIGTVAAGTTTFTHTTAKPGVIYEYRLVAYNDTTNSVATSNVSVTTSGTATNYQLWCKANTLPMDASGDGDFNATPANDGITNTVKYGLGLSARVSGYAGRLTQGTYTDPADGTLYQSLVYIYPSSTPASFLFRVAGTSDFVTWTTGVQVSRITGGGLTTVTKRDTVPLDANSPRRFLRLEVTVPTN
jgi:hypothetical protein